MSYQKASPASLSHFNLSPRCHHRRRWRGTRRLSLSFFWHVDITSLHYVFSRFLINRSVS